MSLVSPILGYKQYHHSNLISLLAFYRLSKLNLHLALYPQLFLGFQKYMKQKSHVHTCICIFQLKQLSSLCRNPQEFNTDSFVCCVASFVSASFFNICRQYTNILIFTLGKKKKVNSMMTKETRGNVDQRHIASVCGHKKMGSQ